MGKGWILGPMLATACTCGLAGPALGQTVIERDTKVTGPRGRTTERDIRVQRGPGYIDRQVEIKRPGETIIRDTRVSTGGGGRPWGGPGPGPRYYGGPRVVEEVFVPGPPVVEEVFVPRPPAVSAFVGVPFFNLFLGGGGPPLPPPPPVIVYPEGVVYAPPIVVAPPPPVVAPAPPPQEQVVLDPLAGTLGRLKSLHSNSRRDGALELGHLGDDRAVTPLIDRLQHDTEKEVRVAAAWALGEIGDPRAGVPLERAALYDKRHEVRDAATIAHRRLPKPGQVQGQSQGQGDPGAAMPAGAPAPTTRRQAPPQSRPTIVSQPEVLDPGPPPLDNSPPPPPSPPLESPRDRS